MLNFSWSLPRVGLEIWVFSTGAVLLTYCQSISRLLLRHCGGAAWTSMNWLVLGRETFVPNVCSAACSNRGDNILQNMSITFAYKALYLGAYICQGWSNSWSCSWSGATRFVWSLYNSSIGSRTKSSNKEKFAPFQSPIMKILTWFMVFFAWFMSWAECGFGTYTFARKRISVFLFLFLFLLLLFLRVHYPIKLKIRFNMI